MLSSHYNDSFSIIPLFIQRMAYHHTLYWSLGECFTDINLCYHFFIFIDFITDITIQFLKSIRIGMSNKQFILLKDSTNLKRQFIIHPFRILSRNNTFFICYFFTISSPSSLYSIAIFILSERVNSWSHSIIKQRIRLGKIDNRKGVLLINH